MAEYKRIVIVNVREDGQPDKLISLGDNDNISDDILSPTVKDAVASVPGLKDATGILNNQVTSLNTATGTLQTQIDGIEGISVTAIENDVVTLFAATGSNFNDITGIQDATGSLQTQIDAIEGISVTAIENDIITLFAATGTNFDNINAIGVATGTLETDIGVALAGTGTLQNSLINVNAFVLDNIAGTGTNFDNIQTIGVATGTLETDIGTALAGTGTNFDNIDAIGVATGTLDTNVGIALNGTGTNFDNIATIGVATGTLQNSLINVNSFVIDNIAGTGTNFENIAAIGVATGTLDTNVGIALNGTGTNFDNIDAIGVATGTLQSQINAIDGVANPLTEDLDVTGFQILNVEKITGDPNELRLKFDHKGFDFNAGLPAGGGAATGTVAFYTDQVILSKNSSFADPDAAIHDVGRQVPLNDGAGVYVSGNGAGDVTGVVPPDGAALTFQDDATPGNRRFVWKKVGATNIGNGAILENNIADGAVGSDKLATDAASDNIAAGALNSIAFNKLPLINAESFVGNDLGYGGNMRQFTAATAKTLLDMGGSYSVGTTAPTSPTGGDLWYNTTDDELYTYDSGRAHWLGAPHYISLGKTTSTAPGVGHYLYVGHAGTTATTQERGWLVPHDMVITGWRAHTKSTFTGWTFRIDKNSGGTNTTGIVSTGALGAVDTFSDFTLDVDVAAGDIIGVPGVTGTSTIDNSTMIIKIQRKGA